MTEKERETLRRNGVNPEHVVIASRDDVSHLYKFVSNEEPYDGNGVKVEDLLRKEIVKRIRKNGAENATKTDITFTYVKSEDTDKIVPEIRPASSGKGSASLKMPGRKTVDRLYTKWIDNDKTFLKTMMKDKEKDFDKTIDKIVKEVVSHYELERAVMMQDEEEISSL